ncbi:MAG: putative acyl-CoA transferase/carnitine dehydratase [Deltaproteobacteria bacterium]|nr:putative acyl-CoA transferase/carnitine dehydratase [Deltaproteobacteria bacterium]
MALALEGIKIIELAQLAAVPMAGRLLGDLGADVIHIEHPAMGDVLRVVLAGHGVDIAGPNYIWENYSRNKRSMTLDVSTPAGQDILYKLVATADVFLTNMRPFEMEKYALGYADLSQRNPNIIYGSVTGVGKRGPERNEPGYDATGYWARSGVAHSVTPLDIPPDFRVGAFGDNLAGLSLAFAIMTALFVRERTGHGQEVDLSLLQTGVYQLSWFMGETLVTHQDRPHVDRRDIPNVLMNAYRTRDQRWLLLCLLQPDRYWSALCRAIGRQDLEHDPRFASHFPRLQNHVALIEILDAVFATKTLDEWKECLTGIPCAPIQKLTEVITDPQAHANDMFVSLDHPQHGRLEVVGPPFHLSRTPATVRTPGPEFGQHTEEVLLECGYTWDDLEQFKRDRVIA